MEIDSKDSEIEQLSQKLASASADTQSNISSGAENECEDGVQVSPLLFFRYLLLMKCKSAIKQRVLRSILRRCGGKNVKSDA